MPADLRGKAIELFQKEVAARGGNVGPRMRLADFVRDAWPVYSPSSQYESLWHIDAIAEHCEALVNGEIKYLMVLTPPRMGKSTVIACMLVPWAWSLNPGLRWIYTSYSAELTIRDSRAARSIIESPWYQNQWGAMYGFDGKKDSEDQFYNSRGGHRIALSVGGRGTGEGCDYVVCLRGDVPLYTDQGWIPIEKIVEERLPVKVMGSGGWQDIEAYEKNPGRDMIRVTCENGATIVCTEDHLLYVDGRGWLEARKLAGVLGEENGVYLRRVRQEVRSPARSRSKSEDWTFLLKSLLWGLRNRITEPGVPGQGGGANLRPLRCAVLPVQGGGECSKGMLEGLRGEAAGDAVRGAMSSMWRFVQAAKRKAGNLLESMHGARPRTENIRQAKRAMGARGVADAVFPWLHQVIKGFDTSEGRQRMCCLPVDQAGAGASRRWIEDEPRKLQPSEPLRQLPPEGTHENRNQPTVDEPVRVLDIQRVPREQYVYNVRVAPYHDYYAGGILAHNCDDPHNIQKVNSPAHRREAIHNWTKVLPSRIDVKERGGRILTMQPSHPEDLAQYVKRNHRSVTVLSLPNEYEPTTWISPIGWSDPRKEEGELLCPSRLSRDSTEDLKHELQEAYYGQYQMRPTRRGGGIFKRTWWKFWYHANASSPPSPVTYEDDMGRQVEAAQAPLPLEFDLHVQSWDCSFKGKESSDSVSGQHWAFQWPNRYLLDRINGKMGYVETKDAIRSLKEAWPIVDAILVEDKANGTAVVEEMVSEIDGLMAYPPPGVTLEPKETRHLRTAPSVGAGQCWLPHPEIAPWVDDFIRIHGEIVRGGVNQEDDDVDAHAQAFLYAKAMLDDVGGCQVWGGNAVPNPDFGQAFIVGV